MPLTAKPVHVAYLAPEIPSLSATFVYEELLSLERMGYRVAAFSVRRPAAPALEVADLAARTEVLYEGSRASLVLSATSSLPSFGLKAVGKSLVLLATDMWTVRPWRIAAWKLAYQWLAGAHFAKRLVQMGCDHLHVHFAHVPAQIAMYASALSGVPFTVVAHANDIFERGLLLRQKAARAVKMLPISRHNMAFLRTRGVPDHQMEVVRCGVSLPPRAMRPSYQQETVYRLGTLGRLVEKKGFDDVLRALALLLQGGQSVQLSIAGDGPLLRPLQALVTELGLGAQVKFEGAMSHADVARWLQSLHVFVLACKPDSRGDMDGIPVVLMEAMSQRVPVVSTRISGVPELIVHGQTGLLADHTNPAQLAAELQSLLASPELRRRLADDAVLHVDAEFGQAVNLGRLVRFFSAGHGQASGGKTVERNVP